MAGEQFSLCWDNFHANMSSGLSSLLKSEDLVDVTLAAEGRYLKAHKMVLSVCSPYFRELFQVNPCKHPIVFLKDVSYNAMHNLLEFMYQGEVKVSQDDLGTFIKTAEALKIKGLTGDGTNQPETEPETPVQNDTITTENTLPPVRKSVREREKSPPVRKKMMGPASKRFKSDVQPQDEELPPLQPISTVSTHVSEPERQLTNAEQIMHFKMEPEETAVSLSNDDEVHYDDSNIDDMTMDNSNDYLLESTTGMEMKEMKPGTSTSAGPSDATPGENQGLYKFVVTQVGTLNLALHQHIYRPRNVIPGTTKRLWICTWRDKHCPAKCISQHGKLISKKGMHNHPPQREAIASKESTGHVCYRKLF